jgi:hypothetical protein
VNTIYESPVRFWFASLVGRAAFKAAQFAANVAAAGKRKRLLLALLCVTLALGATLTAAQNPPAEGAELEAAQAVAQTVPTGGISGQQMAQEITSALDQALQKLKSNASMKSFGDKLLGLGVFIGMMWGAFKTMAGGKGIGELIGEWVPIFVGAGVVVAIIDPAYGGARQIVSQMDSLASSVTGADVSTLTSLLGDSTKLIFNSIYLIADTSSATDGSAADLLSGKIMYMVGSFIFVNIMKMVTIFLVLLAGCVFLATAAMAMVSVELVVCLAPVMVPFLIFKPMSWVFDSWLRFLLGACMMKLVAAFMFLITGKLFEALAKVAAKIAKDSAGTASMDTLTADVTLYGFMVLLAVMAALFMAQVPSIATGLLQGSAGGAGFSGIKGLTQSAGARAANYAGGAAGQGAKSGVSSAYNSTVGAQRASSLGASDARNGVPSGATRFNNNSQNRAYQKSYRANAPSKEQPAPPQK